MAWRYQNAPIFGLFSAPSAALRENPNEESRLNGFISPSSPYDRNYTI